MLFKKMTFTQFKNLSISDMVQYKIQSDQRPIGSYAKIVRVPYVAVIIIFLEPYQYGNARFDTGQVIVADRLEISFADSLVKKQCNVCNAYEGIQAIEVFGKILEQECGCSACLGVSYFPFESDNAN